MSTEAIKASMALIVADCETDVAALDGRPFNGLAVGENFGNVYAMVQAVAKANVALIEEIESLRRVLNARTEDLV